MDRFLQGMNKMRNWKLAFSFFELWTNRLSELCSRSTRSRVDVDQTATPDSFTALTKAIRARCTRTRTSCTSYSAIPRRDRIRAVISRCLSDSPTFPRQASKNLQDASRLSPSCPSRERARYAIRSRGILVHCTVLCMNSFLQLLSGQDCHLRGLRPHERIFAWLG
jgi:hypothetical protein